MNSPLLSPARRLLAFKALPGFGELPPEQLLSLGDISRTSAHEPGEVIQRAGLLPERIHLVVRGAVEVERDGCAPSRVGELAVVAAWAALAGEPASSSARVVEPTVTLSASIRDFEAVVVDSFGIYRSVLRALARAVSSLRRGSGSSRFGQDEEPLSRRGEGAPARRGGGAPDVAERLALLARTDELAPLPLGVLAALAVGVQSRELAPGDRPWEVGARQTYALLPVDAAVRFGDGERVGSGRLLGFDDALAGDPRRAEVEVEKGGWALRLPRRLLLDELEDDEEAARRFLRRMAQRQLRYEGFRLLRGEPASGA